MYRKLLCSAFTDYAKSLNSVDNVSMFNATGRQGVRKSYCRIMEDLCKERTAFIKFHEDPEKVPVQKKN